MKRTLGWSLLGAVLILAVAWMTRGGEEAAPVPTLEEFGEPLAVAEFEDGYRFEVLKVGIGSVEAGQTVMPKGTLTRPVATGSRTTVDGKLTSIETEYYSLNGKLVGLRSEAKNAPAMLLCCVLRDGDGESIPTDAVLGSGTVLNDAIAEAGSYAVDPLRFRGSEAMRAESSKGTKGVPNAILQVRDAKFGWITGEGLLTLDDGGGNRLLAQFPAWPRATLRTDGKLDFRVVLAGRDEVAEFTLDQSMIASSKVISVPGPAAEKASIPTVIKGEDYELEINKVEMLHKAEFYPVIGLESEFTRKMPGDAGRYLEEGLTGFFKSDFYWQFGESKDGNRVTAQIQSFSEIGVEQGVSTPFEAGESVVFEGLLQRSVGNPRRRDECMMVGSGEVAEDGESISIVLDGEAEVLGLKRFELVPDSTVEVLMPYYAKTKKTGFHGFRVEFELEMDEAMAHSFVPKLGEFIEWEPAVFLDDEPYSAGVLATNRSETGDSFSGVRTVSASYEWESRLTAGQKVRVGLTKRKESEVIRIEVEVPEQ